MAEISRLKVCQKDIVLLPFPFSDLQGSKVRPALVVSNDIFNRKSDDCIMVPLTTVIKDEPYSIVIEQRDLKSGSIPMTSRVRADKLFSVEKKLVLKNIGTINDAVFAKVKQEILPIF